MRFAPDIGRKAADTSAPAQAAASLQLPSGMAGRPYRANWDLERAIRDGMEKVTWVFRAMDAIASNFMHPPMRARAGDPIEGAFIDGHAVARIMNTSSNPFEQAGAFRYRLMMQALASKKGVFIEKQYSRAGDLIALYLLNPTYVNPVPHPTKFVDYYELHVPGNDIVQMATDKVLWLKLRPHPTNPYLCLTPLEALGLTIDIDWLTRRYNRNFVASDGRPGGILIVAGDIDEDDADDLRDRFSGPPSQQGRVSVLSGDDAKYVDTAITPREAQYVQASKLSKEEILMGFGVPESKLGNASGRTFDNADAEDGIFWQETMIPPCSIIAQALDTIDGDPETFLVFDFSSIEVLSRHERDRAKYSLEEVKEGAISREEYRDVTGWDPTGDPSMAEYYIQSTYQPIGAPIPTAANTPAPAPAKVADPLETKQLQIPNVNENREEFKAFRASSLARDERLVTNAMQRHFARERKVVISKLGGAKWARRQRARSSVQVKQLDPKRIFDVAAWKKMLTDDLRPLIEELWQRWGDESMKIFGKAAEHVTEDKAVNTSFDLHDPNVTRKIDEQMNRLTNVEDTTYDDISNAIAEGEAEGGSIADIAAKIQGVFDTASTSRAETIARTEVVGAANGASIEGAAQDGFVESKEWLTAQDDRVRGLKASDEFDHASMDGVIVGLNDAFDVSGEALDYPGDPLGSPGNVIACRCTLVFS